MRKIFLFLMPLFSLAMMAQQYVTPDEMEELLSKKATLIDVRKPQVYMYDHVAGAHCFPIGSDDLEKRIKSLPKKRPVVLYGDSTSAAEPLAELMTGKGFNVSILNGGVEAWVAADKQLYQFRDTAELYGYFNGYGDNPNATGRATLHLNEEYVLLNMGSRNIYFNLHPDDLIFAREKDGETNLVFINPEEHYKYIRVELSERHFHLIITSKQTGETSDYCFTLDRE